MANGLPLVLMILDGWGYSEEKAYNAIALANTPHWDSWWKSHPHILLEASGDKVGLPSGQMGNSEVGHMHIGAGRIIPQDFSRIKEAIKNGDFAKNPVFINTITAMKKEEKAIHVLGLLSSGGVHSHEEHLFAFLQLCAKENFNKVYLHLFLDGRDTPPKSAKSSLAKLKEILEIYPIAKICSITGRYYAMDRDKRWERVEPVYRLLTESKSLHHFNSAEDAINNFYKEGIYDEFIPPTIIGDDITLKDGDSIFFFNFRADRARQLTSAIINKDFDDFVRVKTPKISSFISMTQYAEFLPTKCAFPPITLHNTLGEVLEEHGLRQLRIAETEKYAHVTFFLNGGSEKIFAHEDRVLISSPLVATYDLTPKMSAEELTKSLIKAINSGKYDVIICNYANADMVGHSGNLRATIEAIEYLDIAMNEVAEALDKLNGQLLITADHGNAESMFNEVTNQAQTAHTNYPVPLVYIGSNWKFNTRQGSLIDVAPTILKLLDIKIPKEMTGKALLGKEHEAK